LLITEKDGRQRYESYETKDAAEEAKRAINRAQAGPTLWEAMLSYFEYLERKGLKEHTVKTERYRLQSFFELDQPQCKLQQVPLTEITAEQCAALYVKQTDRMSVDTHRNTLTKVKAFLTWCVKQKLIEASPAVEVEPIGRRKRGKEQLRVDEARKFMAVCQKHAAEGDSAAVAAMTALLLGLRGSEVVERMVRDLDDGGRLLWIPKAKTEAGKRMLEVPESLRPLLAAVVKGKKPTDRIFTWKDRHWLLYHVRRMCREAGVPEVTAHSLRGLHATLAMEWGSTGRAVAAALGHTSFAMTTKRHYVAEGTSERMAQRRVGSMLDPWHKSEDGEAAQAVVHDAAAVAGQHRSTAAATPAVTVIRRPGRPVFRVIEGGAGRADGNRETTSQEA
jgi:integrase